MTARDREKISRLWDELADFPASQSDAACLHLLEELRKWLRADSVAWAGRVRVQRGAAARQDPQCGWRQMALISLHPLTMPQARRLHQLLHSPTDGPCAICRSFMKDAGHFRVYRLRHAFGNFPALQRIRHFETLRRSIELNDRMWVSFPVNADTESFFIFDLCKTRRRFSRVDEDRAIRLLRGIKWFHRQMLLSHGLTVAATPLTPVERKVAHALLTDKQEKEIAWDLNLAPVTVHTYAKQIYRKLGVRRRSGLTSLWLGRSGPSGKERGRGTGEGGLPHSPSADAGDVRLMNARRKISARRFEAMHRLWDEVADFPASQSDAAVIHLMKTIAGWIDAHNAIWLGTVRLKAGVQAKKDLLRGWRVRVTVPWRPLPPQDEKFVRQLIREQDDDPGMASMATARLAGQFRVHRMRDGFIDFDAFRRTRHYRIVYQDNGIDDRIWVGFPVNADVESFFLFDKKHTPARFSAADAALAAGALRAIKWFHRRLLLGHGLLAAETPLMPAERRMVRALLTDKREREIACDLGLTVTTAHTYAKDIYRRFGVAGRSGLSALWLGQAPKKRTKG